MNIKEHITRVETSTKEHPIEYAIVALVAQINFDGYPNHLFSITNQGCYTNTGVFPEANCKVYPTSDMNKIDIDKASGFENDLSEMIKLNEWTHFIENTESITDSHLYSCDAMAIINDNEYKCKLFFFERNPKIYDPYEMAYLTYSKETNQFMGFVKFYNCKNPFI